ncbi:glycosyltransferase family 4 protein [Haliea sp. E1-2-M8]|uniref:glycosyltransferase family 4 protein n=1 Tax=Haliea sp. E1-2-M8 TaxID=3064706 RepID=UPI00271AF990|nr:glycosyltransferase family 4 protein [Haliea sp. E1-2-M8]MDO8861105.1 glycosyltransferase family 4 protein [Haliea sp. E1-2-M8]
MTRVVMVVNNPATSDYRVVKSAEALVADGYDCHVLGVLRPGYASQEVINGVTYHRVRLRVGLASLLIGFFPEIVRYLEKPPRKFVEGPEQGRSLLGLLLAILIRLCRTATALVFKTLLSVAVVLLVSAAVAGFFIFYFAAIPYLAIRFLSVAVSTVIKSIRSILTGKQSSYRIVASSLALLFNSVVAKTRSDTIRVRSVANNGERGLKTALRRMRSFNRKTIAGLPFFAKLHLKLRVVIHQRINKLRPQISPIGVRYLQGRHLASWYRPLLDLRADVYHAHELWSLQACAMAAKAIKAKLVYDSHELEAHRNNDWCKASNATRIHYEKRYIRQADAVISVSSGCADEIRRSYGLEKVHLLRNTPLLGTLTPSGTNLRTCFGLDDDTPLMVYTGSVTINRGLELVLKALQELPQFHLVTVGPWNQSVQDKLLTLAQTLGVREQFHSYPKVPPEELIDLISTADLAIIPIQNACLSYYYCLPNKLFEAAFAGLPIVASNLPDMREFILGNELGCVFDSDDPEALAEAVATTYARRAEYKSEQSTEWLRKRYCFEQERNVLTGIYDEIAGHAVE